jgi:hypothetical protein
VARLANSARRPLACSRRRPPGAGLSRSARAPPSADAAASGRRRRHRPLRRGIWPSPPRTPAPPSPPQHAKNNRRCGEEGGERPREVARDEACSEPKRRGRTRSFPSKSALQPTHASAPRRAQPTNYPAPCCQASGRGAARDGAPPPAVRKQCERVKPAAAGGRGFCSSECRPGWGKVGPGSDCLRAEIVCRMRREGSAAHAAGPPEVGEK